MHFTLLKSNRSRQGPTHIRPNHALWVSPKTLGWIVSSRNGRPPVTRGIITLVYCSIYLEHPPHFALAWLYSVRSQQVSTHFRPNQAHTASPKMCRMNSSSRNTCGRGIGNDASGYGRRHPCFPCCALSLSLFFLVGLTSWSRGSFFYRSHSSRD